MTISKKNKYCYFHLPASHITRIITGCLRVLHTAQDIARISFSRAPRRDNERYWPRAIAYYCLNSYESSFSLLMESNEIIISVFAFVYIVIMPYAAKRQ